MGHILKQSDMVATVTERLAALGRNVMLNGSLRAARHALLARALDEREPEQTTGGARGVELDAEQVQERDVVLVGDLVEPVDEQIGHPRRELAPGKLGLLERIHGSVE